MEKPNKRPSEAIDVASNKLMNEGLGFRNAEGMQGDNPSDALDSLGETEVYDQPLPPPPYMAPLPAPPPAPAYVPYAPPPGYWEQRAAYAAAQQRSRALALEAAARTDRGAGAFTVVNLSGARATLREKRLPIETDPLVRQLASQKADVVAKLNQLMPVLTFKQAEKIKGRLDNISRYMKGKKRGQTKEPTQDQLQKVLFRALEMHAARRAAQLGAQARRARKERHALQNHKRGIALPDGTTIGNNKRHYKKLATNALQKVSDGQVAQEKRALRLQLTNQNKQERMAVAAAHDRKINPKDRIPASK